MQTVAIDLGGTRIKAGIVDKGRIIDHFTKTIDHTSDFYETMGVVEEVIAALIQRNGLTFDGNLGIGLATPGIVDPNQKRILSIDKKHCGAVGFDFLKWINDRYQAPFCLNHDTRSALIGEWQFGAGRGTDDLVMITLGTGIGAVAMMNGKIVYGKHYQAACLGGHFTIDRNGAICNCGNIGCAETLASSWSLKDRIAKNPYISESTLRELPEPGFPELFKEAEAGDQLSNELIEDCLRIWASTAVSMIHAYDPDRIILAGGIVTGAANRILPYIEKWVKKHAWTPWGRVEVCIAENTDHAALLGLHYLLNNSSVV